MFCKHCGKKIPDYARFCIYCGEAVEPIAPSPNSAPVAETAPVSEASEFSVSPDIPQSTPDFFHQPPTLSPAENMAPETAPDTLEDIPDILPPEDQPLEELYVPESRLPLNPEPIGSYQEIMEEFSHVGKDKPASENPQTEDKNGSPSPQKPLQSKQQKILALLGARKRIFLISGLILGLCLVAAAAFLVLRIFAPASETPVLDSPPPSVLETVAETPKAEASDISEMPEDSELTALPQIAPPVAEAVDSSVEETTETILYVDGVAHSAYFRSTPTQEEDNILSSVPLGTAVVFLDRAENDFYRVLLEGTTGYIASAYLSETLPDLEIADTAYISGVDYCAYLRSSPEKNDDNILDMLYLNDSLGFIEEAENGYARVRAGDTYGYVYMEYLSFTPPSTTSTEILYVSGIKNGAYLLKYPRQGTEVLNTLAPGTTVGYIEDSLNGYCRVIYGDTAGYILGSYLSDTNPASQENLAARQVLLSYAEDYICFLDINGDGIEEMLTCNTCQKKDGLSVTTSARLFLYQPEGVTEVASFGDETGDRPILYLKQEDGSITLVAEKNETGLYSCTFYRLGKEGLLTYEAWSIERENGEKKYYVNENGTKEETTQEAYSLAVENRGYFYATFEEAQQEE